MGLTFNASPNTALGKKIEHYQAPSRLIGKIAIHAGDRANTAALHRSDQFAKQVAGPEKLAAMVIRHFSRIKSHNAAAVQKYCVDLQDAQ
jgi:hypothetical protein